MNDKLTATEAALYLGQEVMYYNHRYESTKLGKLSVTLLNELFNTVGYKYTVKLLLRPLSDITEEEFQEYNAIAFEFYDSYTKYKSEAATTKFLLSKGFDLFNWIEAGKALDKTKTTV